MEFCVETAQEKRLLSKKVSLIYRFLCLNDMQCLAELLSDARKVAENPKYLSHRKKVLRRIIDSGTAKVGDMQRSFSHMKIAGLQMHKRALFKKEEFFTLPTEDFEERLKMYMYEKKQEELAFDFRYRYLYVFDHKEHNGEAVIECYEIDYLTTSLSKMCPEGVVVRFHSQICGDIYDGCIHNDGSRVRFHVYNHQDSMLLLFNRALESGSNEPLFDKALYGAAIGIDDANRQIVVAKKVALMQHTLDERELQRLYLVLNETQKIEAHENRYALEHDISLSDTRYLRKYDRQIKEIHHFFSTLRQSDTIPATLRDHMVFAEYYPFCMLFEKYAADQNFFLTDRKRIMVELLHYLKKYPPGCVRMVLPLYAPQENIFLYPAVEQETLFELLMQRVRAGVKFEIVFVIGQPQDYKNAHMEGVFAQLEEAGVSFGFVDREMASEATYRDFVYTDARDVAIIKDHPARREVFTITKEKAYIEGCARDFALLRAECVGYEDVMDEQCVLGVHDSVLRQLMGRWYGYFYGSTFDERGEPRLWEMLFEIGNDYSVIEKRNSKLTATGKVLVSRRQCLLMMDMVNGKSSYHFVFDHEKIDEAFHVMGVSQHILQREYFASRGIFSRKRLGTEQAKSLLGSAEACMMVPDPDSIQRLQEYLNQLRVSSLTHAR